MGRNCQVYCKICMKTMRSDHLERHVKQHENKSKKEENISQNNENIENVEMKIKFNDETTGLRSSRSNLPDKSNKYSGYDDEALRKTLKTCNEEYKEKIKLGERVYKIVGEDGIIEESIPPLYKDSMNLFVKQKQTIDQQNVTLRAWQEDLLNKIENPTYREVIWVKGAKGCEGKSWFQGYIESKYGWNRVVSGMDIKAKNSSICHALGKRPLTTTDIFLFNVGKAKTFDDVNYEVIEKLKDGKLLASKYDSKELRIRTPNVVVVFSNDNPKVGELALDRWCIFSIIDNKLVDITGMKLTPKGCLTTTNENGTKTEYLY